MWRAGRWAGPMVGVRTGRRARGRAPAPPGTTGPGCAGTTGPGCPAASSPRSLRRDGRIGRVGPVRPRVGRGGGDGSRISAAARCPQISAPLPSPQPSPPAARRSLPTARRSPVTVAEPSAVSAAARCSLPADLCTVARRSLHRCRSPQSARTHEPPPGRRATGARRRRARHPAPPAPGATALRENSDSLATAKPSGLPSRGPTRPPSATPAPPSRCTGTCDAPGRPARTSSSKGRVRRRPHTAPRASAADRISLTPTGKSMS